MEERNDLEARLRALEPPYRSKREAQVGRMLDRYGIPFFYEQPTLVYDHGRYTIWHPDFTLPEQNGLVIEYAGMMDVPDYAAGIRHKREAYQANGIAALFLYPVDMAGAAWEEKVYAKIQQAQPVEPWRELYQQGIRRLSWVAVSGYIQPGQQFC